MSLPQETEHGLRVSVFCNEVLCNKFKDFPETLRIILNPEDPQWQDFKVGGWGELKHFDRFEDFLAWIGTTYDVVKDLCRRDVEVVDLLDRVMQKPVGVHHDSNNVTITNRGNTASAALRRLRKDRPELHQQVIAGELSPHAAMLNAGFREKKIQISLDPVKAAESLRKHFSDEAWHQLKQARDSYLPDTF
jgi:hypothetical protein